MFNVTNPEEVSESIVNSTTHYEVTHGVKPILKQIGPYCYTKNKTHISTFSDDNEVISAFGCSLYLIQSYPGSVIPFEESYL